MAGKVKPGSVADNPVATWDFLPTFAEIVNTQKPEDIDGISFLQTLLGNEDQQKKHEYLYWEFYELGGRQAIRVGDWKYLKLNVRDKSVEDVKELYNIANDPSEENNLISEYADKAQELDSLMSQAHIEHNLLSLFEMDKDAETKF